VRVSAKVDYAVRAMTELAATDAGHPVKGDQLAAAQQIPTKFLENILGELRTAGLVSSQRGAEGGYWLARAADDINVAEIIRAVEGPLANVRGVRPENLELEGTAKPLQEMWVAVRASLRGVLEHVTLADLASADLPDVVRKLAADPDTWEPH
jgi:Rrf2 family protein